MNAAWLQRRICARRDGFDPGGVLVAVELVLDLDRHAVAVSLQRVGTQFVPKYGEAKHTNRSTEAPFEIPLDLSRIEQHEFL